MTAPLKLSFIISIKMQPNKDLEPLFRVNAFMELFTEEEYSRAKYRDGLKLQCDDCGNIITRRKKNIQLGRKKGNKTHGCSKCCKKLSMQTKGFKGAVEVSCDQCSKKFFKLHNQIQKSKKNFCSRSCNATYYNAHKKYGTRRSKLEVWLEEQLPKLYPDLEFKFNSKEEINSELDVYIPSLKLAFELNGIFHYEPIYGQDKLDKIQNNDERKFQACLERGIELCIIDSSNLKYFKPVNAQKYLDLIQSIIEKRRERDGI